MGAIGEEERAGDARGRDDLEGGGANERARLLDAVVRQLREDELELVGVSEAAGDQVTGLTSLDERERQELKLPEVVEPDQLEDARAGHLDMPRIEVAGDAPQ